MSKLSTIKKMIIDTMNTLDKSGLNGKRYSELLNSFKTEAALTKFLEKLVNDPNEFFYLEVLPYKNEPSFDDIEKAAKLLNIPLEEYVYIRNTESGRVVKSKNKVIVGYLPIKRLQQLLVKKNAYELNIDIRSGKTGQISESDKVGRISDAENYTLSIIGADKFLQEVLGPRADNMDAKMQMYKDITNEGYCSLERLTSDIENHTTLNTVNVYLIGAGLHSDLVNETLALGRTVKNKNRK